MLGSDEGEGDLFFDSVDCFSYEETSLSEKGLDCAKLEYEIWLNEPQSVRERRQSFIREMGLVEFVSKKDETVVLERITECSGAVPSSSVLCTSQEEKSLVCCGRQTNTGANSMVDDGDEYQIDTKESVHSKVEECENSDVGKKKMKSWWRYLVNKRKKMEGRWESEVLKLNHKVRKTERMIVKQNKKRCMEFTGVYMGQEIQAHKGLIWTMKFSPDGRYLATGGEDGVVRIWYVTSVDASCKSFTSEFTYSSHSTEEKASVSTKKTKHASIILPENIFQIDESPVQEFHGHTSDVLDLAWSNSNYLLSSSKDKTVRLWQVGCKDCLNVFHHSNYVTCIQFNPVDENYFISGSIDGKIRIWGWHEKRVVDWADMRDVISAICYQPDGRGFVVGSITGTCRFYEASGNDLQLEAEIHIQGRKKTSGKRITGIQFSSERYQRVMITSEDSKIRIFDGVDVVQKFKGLPKSGSQMSASFTSNGRHIISVGEDSRIYVWNHDGLCTPSSKHIKSVQACEHFLSECVSVAVPWSGMGTEQRRGLDGGSLRGHVRMEDAAFCRRDLESFSLGTCFFVDGPCRGSSATWPEEAFQHWHHQDLQQQVIEKNDQTALSESWGLVIVTAGWDGRIRTYHNYGLPVRLK